MTTSPQPQQVFAGIDTHKDQHHVAVIDADGHVLGRWQIPATVAGYSTMLMRLSDPSWHLIRVGVESTGSYGAALTTVLHQEGIEVRDVNFPDLRVRAAQGKSDPIDAQMAAEAARSGRARVIPKDHTGIIEAIRVIYITRRLAVRARSAAQAQLKDLLVTAPAALRDHLTSTTQPLTQACLRLRPDSNRSHDPLQATKLALRSIARRITTLNAEITDLDTHLQALTTHAAPRLLSLHHVGPRHAAQLLITAGQNITRLGSEAQFARLTGVAPVPASSGKTRRMRLHKGGDRQANSTIHMIAIGRLKNYQPAIDYYTRKQAQGFSKTDAIRAMKRYIARELYRALKTDLKALDAL